jgi:hypothetical protein
LRVGSQQWHHDEYNDRTNLKEERLILAQVSEMSVHCGRRSMAEWTTSLYSGQEVKRECLSSLAFSFSPFIPPSLPPYGMIPPTFRKSPYHIPRGVLYWSPRWFLTQSCWQTRLTIYF